MSDVTPLTYRELGERLGLSPDSARIKAKRRKWQTIPGNHPSDPVRVLVPVEFLNGERAPERKARGRTLSAPLDNAGEINVLREHVQTLRELFDQQKATHAAELERIDADQARLIEERTQLQDELREARAEADHAKADQVRMAQDVVGMFDELRVLAEKHADRARLEGELERARQDADRQRADHADLEQVRDELDRARQDAGLWREEADRERVRIANLQADAEHIEQEMARLQAELEQARRPWWRRLVGR